jgi:hypothetical protein
MPAPSASARLTANRNGCDDFGMTMLGLVILSLTTGVLPQPTTTPGFLDAAKLVAFCGASGPDAKAGQAICMGYVVGAVDQLLVQQARRDEVRRTICPPKTLSATDAMKAVVKYSRFASTAHGIGAASFVRFAMEDTYPCTVRGVGP